MVDVKLGDAETALCTVWGSDCVLEGDGTAAEKRLSVIVDKVLGGVLVEDGVVVLVDDFLQVLFVGEFEEGGVGVNVVSRASIFDVKEYWHII